MKEIYLANNNNKMPYLNWSIPAVKTCPGSTPYCRKHCYSLKAEKRFSFSVPACRNRNLVASKKNDFVEKMVSIISKRKNREYFRIHSDGDFYDQTYLDKWFDICRSFPKTNFLAFTKSFKLNYSNKPSNLNIVWSIMPDTVVKTIPTTGPRAYAGDCEDMPNAIDCIGHCGNCGVCWGLKENVHFKMH
jgi:hypothetical protein